MWPFCVGLASKKQLAILVEFLTENGPCLAQVLMNLRLAHSHSLCNYFWVEDRPSAPLALPRIRVARCGKGMLLERMIGTESTNALKSGPDRGPELGKGRHLVQQFPSDISSSTSFRD